MWFVKPKFRDLRQPYLDRKKGRKKSTVYGAEHFSKLLVEFFGDYSICEITEETWKQYETEFRVSFPTKKLHHHHRHFTAMMKMAYNENKVKRRLEIRRPKKSPNAGREYGMGEILAMMNRAVICDKENRRWGQDLRDQIILATLGLRKMEILELAWDRVNFREHAIVLRDVDTKTNNPRVVHLNFVVEDMLMRRYIHKNGPYVFAHRFDPLRARTTNNSAWRALKRKLAIQGRFHDHRVTACVRLLRAGESETATGLILGMTPEIVRRYAQIAHHDQARVASKLDLILS